MAVEVRDAALEHYSASAVLVRFPSGEKVWLPLSQIEQMPGSWSIPSNMSQSRGKHLVVTDLIAKQKGFKTTPRELDIDPERATDKPVAPAQAAKPKAFVDGKAFTVATLEQQVERLQQQLQNTQTSHAEYRRALGKAESERDQARVDLRSAEAQRDKAIADLALAQDALRKATERADKAEAYVAAQGRSHRPEAQSERFALLELE